jgi:hypothetical protein
VTDQDFKPSAAGLQGALALKLLPEKLAQAHQGTADPEVASGED